MANIHYLFGILLTEASFDTISKVHNTALKFNQKEKSLIAKDITLLTFLEMVQEEFEYRTPCDECRDSTNLEPSVKY